MGNRLSKITTRTGDQGTTGLANGERVPKHSSIIQAIGDIDELNASIGLLMCQLTSEHFIELHAKIQNDLFMIGGELSLPDRTLLDIGSLTAIEQLIETHNATLEPLKEFILPNGTLAACHAHMCRTICRRAERSVWNALNDNKLHRVSLIPQYLNRLSDWFFILARISNKQSNTCEQLWTKS